MTGRAVRMRLAGHFAVGIGVALLGLDLLGTTSVGRYESRPPRPWERFDAALAEATPDLDSLYAAAANGADLASIGPEERLVVLFDTVTLRFTHGSGTRHNVSRNWLAWLGGAVYSPAGYMRETESVLRFGHSAWCSEQSTVFAALAERAGVPARIAWLDGHVVAATEYDGAWHAWDTDLEVVPRNEQGTVVAVRTLGAEPRYVRDNYGHRSEAKVAQLVAIYGNVANHRYDERPAASRARRFERAAGWLKWALPLILAVTGAILLRGARLLRV